MTEQQTPDRRLRDAIDTVRRVASEQKLYRTGTIQKLYDAAEIMEQADRALTATIRAFHGGSQDVRDYALRAVERYHVMCGSGEAEDIRHD